MKIQQIEFVAADQVKGLKANNLPSWLPALVMTLEERKRIARFLLKVSLKQNNVVNINQQDVIATLISENWSDFQVK